MKEHLEASIDSKKTVLTHVVRRLKTAGVSEQMIRIFFPEMSHRDLRSMMMSNRSLGHSQGERGRPTEYFDLNTQMHIKILMARLYYEKYDIIQIAEISGVKPDFICYYLFNSTVAFGVKRCKICSKNFVYVNNRDKCYECDPTSIQGDVKKCQESSLIKTNGTETFLCKNDQYGKAVRAMAADMRYRLITNAMLDVYGDLMSKAAELFHHVLKGALDYTGSNDSAAHILSEGNKYIDAVKDHEKDSNEVRTKCPAATKSRRTPRPDDGTSYRRVSESVVR